MPSSQPPHHELPAALLSDPEMVRSCRTRDFSTIFQLVRPRAGIYPSRIAALCGVTPSRVGEIISGQRKLAHIDVIERVADGLRIPGAMLGLAHRPWQIPPRVSAAAPGPEATEEPQTPSLEQRETAGALDDILSLVGDERVTHSTLVAIES